MARGKKTGGRNFAPGNAGRPKGSKDEVPRSVKASIRAVLEDVISSEPGLIRDAIMRGLRAAPPRSFQYVQLAAHYVDGKPEDRLEIRNLANLSDPELEQLEARLARAIGTGA